MTKAVSDDRQGIRGVGVDECEPGFGRVGVAHDRRQRRPTSAEQVPALGVEHLPDGSQALRTQDVPGDLGSRDPGACETTALTRVSMASQGCANVMAICMSRHWVTASNSSRG
ncbi:MULTISPECIES: hypothetical protein [Amycolatopsis]|uniref:hypothetical protein n=1 Tax=Amycolatopsis TaxID=1813 RepID=UPI00339E32D6